MEPRIQYAKTSDGVSIAYYALGEGPPLVVNGSTVGHLQFEWELLRGMWEDIAQRWTLVRYDRRGCGLSERDITDFSVAAMARDLEAVADRLELESFRVVALGPDALVAIAYAAAHPERVSHLVLWHAFARGADWWAGQNEAVWELIQKDWKAGTDAWVVAGLGWTGFGRVSAELWRAAVTPETYSAFLQQMREWDVSHLLPLVTMPTLIMHRRESSIKVEVATRLAAEIPNARLLLLEGSGPMGLDGTRAAQEFLRPDEPPPAQTRAFRSGRPAGRELAPVTILFTDIADSTALTQRLGDAKAQELVRAHNAIVREALSAHSGTEIKHTGDGIMASFPSATGALECAVSIQRTITEQPDDRLSVHIGLNAGEPVAEENDLFGTSVQLARRICDHGGGGEVLASDVVRQLAAGKGFLFSDVGEVALRGFEDPVRLYEVRWREVAS